MRIRHTMLALALGCGVACSGGQSEKSPAPGAGETARPPAALAPARETPSPASAAPVVQSGEATVPKFVAGTYELVLVRDEPVFDDSLAVRDYVERRLSWASVDSARDWRDSARVLDAYFKGLEYTPDGGTFAMEDTGTTEARTSIRRFFEKLACTEWRSGGTLRLEADGQFAREDEIRSYCRGRVPAYTRRTEPRTEAVLQTCESWGPPAPGVVPHLTCRSGRYWDGMYSFRYVGDTLRISSDCDGSETYVLRRPDPPPGRTVARSSDVSRLEEC